MTRVRAWMSHIGFFWDMNRIRLIIMLAILTFLIILNGSRGLAGRGGRVPRGGAVPGDPAHLRHHVHDLPVRGRCSGSCPGRGSTPSRRTTPRSGSRSRTTAASPTCSSTPRARSGSSRAQGNFEKLGGEMPKGMLLSRPTGHRQDVPRRLHRGRGEPAVHLHRRELAARHVLGMDRADGHEAVPRRPRARPQVRRDGPARRLHHVHGRARLDRHAPAAARPACRSVAWAWACSVAAVPA